MSVKPADTFEDRDPRMDGRRLVVLRTTRRFARVVSTAGRQSVIRIDRLLDKRLFIQVRHGR